MLNNKQIAGQFDLLAKLMELHDDNPFKIKTYANAYLSLRKLEGDLAAMPTSELAAIKGVGQSVAEKVKELVATGQMKALNQWKEKTPAGIIQMLSIKGLGPKKVKQIWKEMEILTIGELLYACNENRLVHYSGFGLKLQAEIKEKLEYYQASEGKYLYAHVHQHADQCLAELRKMYPNAKLEIVGDIRRCMPEVKGIEILSNQKITIEGDHILAVDGVMTYQGFPLFIFEIEDAHFNHEFFKRSCSDAFFQDVSEKADISLTEKEIFFTLGVNFMPPEYREDPSDLSKYKEKEYPLIDLKDIQGIVHNHSDYSDGLHTLTEMARYVHQCGYQYFVISDHSKSAGYASGLSVEKVLAQWSEIDLINATFDDGFKILKSIESDILTDGSLDYTDDILKGFDLVIASIHSGLQMDEAKATNRLIKAIENPYTNILGHPTSRLLLARPGYPVDYHKIIDACAANGVAIELNANPQRLDLDWTWIPYAMKQSVYVAINPDAHSKESIHYVKYGVAAARKGGLTKEMCINTWSLNQFEDWISIKKGRN